MGLMRLEQVRVLEKESESQLTKATKKIISKNLNPNVEIIYQIVNIKIIYIKILSSLIYYR